MITLWRVFKTGFRNLFRHAWLSVAATAIMVVTLVVVSFFILTAIFVRKGTEVIREKFDIVVFLQDSATPDKISALQAKLQALPDIKAVVFVSKDEALQQYETSNDPIKRGAIQSAQEAGIGNPLFAQLQIKTTDLSDHTINDIHNVVTSSDYSQIVKSSSIDEGNEKKQTIENVGKISNAVTRIGTVISIAFLVISLLIIFNTIRMAIFTRREEIEIMKLVGATKWFIRGPFIFEGALYGVLGATLAIAIIFPLAAAIRPFMAHAIGTSAIDVVTSRTLVIVAFEYGLGIVIGAVSSWLAISRHLKL